MANDSKREYRYKSETRITSFNSDGFDMGLIKLFQHYKNFNNFDNYSLNDIKEIKKDCQNIRNNLLTNTQYQKFNYLGKCLNYINNLNFNSYDDKIIRLIFLLDPELKVIPAIKKHITLPKQYIKTEEEQKNYEIEHQNFVNEVKEITGMYNEIFIKYEKVFYKKLQNLTLEEQNDINNGTSRK